MTPKQTAMAGGVSPVVNCRLLLAASYVAGTPRHWMTEVGQPISSAMMDFIDYRAGLVAEPSDEALRLVRAYFEYYLNAPNWGPPTTELTALRAQIITARTLEDLNAWVNACRNAGLDPL